MRFEFMGIFHDREGDDRFSKYLRVSSAVCHGIVAGAFWLMGQTAWLMKYRGDSPSGAVVGAAVFSILVFGVVASTDEIRRPYAAPAVMLFALVAGEAAMWLGLWDPRGLLAWWRTAMVLVAVACLILWAGERIVRSRRTRHENPGNSA